MSVFMRRLSEISSMKTGKLNSNAAEPNGIFPFFTCAQETYRINKAAFNTEAVLLGGNNANGVFPLKYYKGEFNAYQRTYIIESLDNEMLNTRFLYYALRPSLLQFQAASIGAATQYLTKPILDNFKINVPDVSIQNKVVDILSAYDDLIKNNKRRIELLEESARQLYKEWFVRFRFPGHEHVNIIDGVPEGWNALELGSVVDVVKDTVQPVSLPEGTPYIGLEHFPRRSFTLNGWEGAEKVTSTKYAFKTGDILFGKIRPYFHKVGFTLIDGITSSDAIVLRPKFEKHYSIILSEVSSDQFIALASKTVREGSKMPRADWNVLKKSIILEPPENILDVFNMQITSIVEQCKLLSLQMANLANARDLLLPKLMNGEVAV